MAKFSEVLTVSDLYNEYFLRYEEVKVVVTRKISKKVS